MKKWSFSCPSCEIKSEVVTPRPPVFCPACGYSLNKKEEINSEKDLSFIQDIPEKTAIQYSIGPYQILQSIGKGGMGEVLLAFDTICGRKIALKRIRTDLLSFKQIKKRFLKEARVTSQLTHPAIIPIYSIHQEDNLIYYTMPYVEGDTLKQILRKARQIEKKGGKTEQLTSSIPALMRIFLSICQAVAYAHSKSILHRDLKPENIIIGYYGEVMILDWGLAKVLGSEEEEELTIDPSSKKNITLAGKVVGTVSYMAPERALGQPASKTTDLYALGVILYQLLTLRMPFRRGTLKEFKESMKEEVLQDPFEVAPYRDIPKEISLMAIKCLEKDPKERYQTIDDLLKDLENYIEGRPEWFKTTELAISEKSDWEFQEHILIEEHRAITRASENFEWVDLMISKASFAENLKIQTSIYLDFASQGVGFLLNVPESNEREHINDGYCLWLSSESTKTSKLLLNSIEILPLPDVYLTAAKWHQLKLEKIDSTIRLFIDGDESFSYISRKPLLGKHIGFMSRDRLFKINSLEIGVSSQNILVNCLAIPDAFLAHKLFDAALSEYRRIAFSFAGRAEGREATLRAGIALIEKAKNSAQDRADLLYEAALKEFETLHRTPAAPLEYLGKALVYQAEKEIDEEIKCFQLAYRRYPNHPLLVTLQNQILFRLAENSRIDRKNTYAFLLLTFTCIPEAIPLPEVNKLIHNLIKNWEPLNFIRPIHEFNQEAIQVTLAFWLHKTNAIEEIFTQLLEKPDENFALLESLLLCFGKLNELPQLHRIIQQFPVSTLSKLEPTLDLLFEDSIEKAFQKLNSIQAPSTGLVDYFFDKALDENRPQLILESSFKSIPHQLWAFLQMKEWKLAGTLFETIPIQELTQEHSILYFLYGCWLYAVEGPEIAQIHWASVLETSLPRSWALASHYISGILDISWFKKAFDWERYQLERQLNLFSEIKQRSI